MNLLAFVFSILEVKNKNNQKHLLQTTTASKLLNVDCTLTSSETDDICILGQTKVKVSRQGFALYCLWKIVISRYIIMSANISISNRFVFSSPEPKARVSYCHSAPSVVRPSVCLSVCPSSVRP